MRFLEGVRPLYNPADDEATEKAVAMEEGLSDPGFSKSGETPRVVEQGDHGKVNGK